MTLKEERGSATLTMTVGATAWLAVGVALVVLGVGGAFSGDLFVGAILGGLGCVWIWAACRARLEVAAQGVGLRGMFRTRYYAWNEIVAARVKPSGWMGLVGQVEIRLHGGRHATARWLGGHRRPSLGNSIESSS